MHLWLWITFKSCIFAFWNNITRVHHLLRAVVNYIQILYLCILKQPFYSNFFCIFSCELHSNLVSLHSETTSAVFTKTNKSCELHSNLVSLHSETTYLYYFWNQRRLWITFKSCIFAFWNNFWSQSAYETTLWITFKSCIFAFWNNMHALL